MNWKSITLHTVGAALLAALALTPLAYAAAPAPGAPAADTFTDPLNALSFELAPGWRAYAPHPRAIEGLVTVLNYDPMEAEQVLGAGEAPPWGWVKVQLLSARRPEGQGLGAWVDGHLAAIAGDTDLLGTIESSERIPYRLAGRDGLAYTVSSPGWGASLNLALDWTADRVLSIGISPADSRSLPDALQLLQSLRPADAPRAEASTTASTAELLRPLDRLLEALPNEPVATPEASCPGPAGTFDQNEAGTSPISIHMPFPADTAWEVGNIGSYFGNGQHCNGLNDYYATDWNRRKTDCSDYEEDLGTETRPVAGGRVDESYCSTSIGYGCRVLVTHSDSEGGIQTRYAHLSDRWVDVDDQLNHWDGVGTVGCSGLSTCGPHLHLSFLENVSGTYYSHCNGPSGWASCPNGLDKAWPQTVKPSPIITSGGTIPLGDGDCNTSANQQGGGGGGFTQTIDDSDTGSVYLGGPAQYWWEPSGYGINNQMHYTYNAQSSGTNWMYWYFNVPSAGNYTFKVYIPRNHATTTSARYWVHDGTAWTGGPWTVDQSSKYDEWVTLGTVYFSSGGTKTLYVGDVTGEATSSTKIGVDAARVIKN